MNCGDCKYGHDVGYALLCWGQKNAPEVDPDHICDGWKPNGEDGGWFWAEKSDLPKSFVSALVYIPSEAPMPTVREGFVVDDDQKTPAAWYIPALRRAYYLSEIAAWKPMPEPPKMT